MIAKVGFGLFRPINGGFLSRPQGQVLLNRLGLFNKTLPILTFSIKELMPIIDWVLSRQPCHESGNIRYLPRSVFGG